MRQLSQVFQEQTLWNEDGGTLENNDTYDGDITSEYAGDNTLPPVTALDDATIEALADAKKVIIRPPNGTVSLELRFRSDGNNNDVNILQLYAAAGPDHYDLMAQLSPVQGLQPHSVGFFCDHMTPATEAWLTAASEIDQSTPADGIGRYVFNTHGCDRFLLVASDLVTTTVYVDWRVH